MKGIVYDFYCFLTNNLLKEHTQRKIDFSKSRDYYLERLKAYPMILALLKFTAEELYEKFNQIPEIEKAIGNVSILNNRNYNTVVPILEQLYLLKDKLRNTEKQITKLTKSQIDSATFNKILKTYNQICINAVIEDNYHLTIPYLGRIYIIRKTVALRRTKTGEMMGSVNWDASNKAKKALLDKGLTPYNKETAPDGEKWLVYNTGTENCWFMWDNNKCTTANYKAYTFRPNVGDSDACIVKKLQTYRKENPIGQLKYKVIANG